MNNWLILIMIVNSGPDMNKKFRLINIKIYKSLKFRCKERKKSKFINI